MSYEISHFCIARLIKLDSQVIIKDMQRVINIETVKTVLEKKGWDQKRLSKEVGVSAQAITNWFKGIDFPRPDKLLKLSTILSLPFSSLVLTPELEQPVVAFRKRAGTKTTQVHLDRARLTGALLRPLVAYLPPLKSLRTLITSPTTQYTELQNAVTSVRHKLGVGMGSAIAYSHLIKEFADNDAVIVPVMWGKKTRHENALHILLKSEKVTFIFLNLDTHLEDFKFWMAHELAHVFTPDLAGTEEGEDFADAFAGALLFPRELAQQAYAQAASKTSASGKLKVLQQYADEHMISLNSVYLEVRNYAKALKLAELQVDVNSIHALRNLQRGELMSEALFKPLPPEPATYIAAASNTFQSSFFDALKKMVRDKGTGAGYVQQTLELTMMDASALHQELIR
jgi:transcriptional regulator with XRE-family HTH domain/Zn-dependent peptidase ImmA (M78 family)